MSIKAFVLFFCLLTPVAAPAQFNMKKLMEEGRTQLDKGFYVNSMQIFQRVVSLKPQLHEAWYLSGLSRYHLEDYEGTERDCTEAIALNPYIADIYELRAMARVKEEKYDSAAIDYTSAIEIDKENTDYWFNRAYCYHQMGQGKIALQQLDYILARWPRHREALELRAAIRSGRRPKPQPKRNELTPHFVLPKLGTAPQTETYFLK